MGKGGGVSTARGKASRLQRQRAPGMHEMVVVVVVEPYSFLIKIVVVLP